MLVAGAGLFGACWLVVNNYRRTNLAYAAVITALQIALAAILFPPLSLFNLIELPVPQRCTKAAAR